MKALELLLYLDEFVPERERQLGQYRSSQVDTIKEIHALLTADLRQRHTIEELSRAYLINTATLNPCLQGGLSSPAHRGLYEGVPAPPCPWSCAGER